ncbi:MAG: hypothetical protein WB443_09230 [Nitrososphaeraceae archaeon]
MQNTNNRKNKIAPITGSSEGIGKAIAVSFVNSGQYSGIVTNSRKVEGAQQVADEIKSLGCDSCNRG